MFLFRKLPPRWVSVFNLFSDFWVGVSFFFLFLPGERGKEEVNCERGQRRQRFRSILPSMAIQEEKEKRRKSCRWLFCLSIFQSIFLQRPLKKEGGKENRGCISGFPRRRPPPPFTPFQTLPLNLSKLKGATPAAVFIYPRGAPPTNFFFRRGPTDRRCGGSECVLRYVTYTRKCD